MDITIDEFGISLGKKSERLIVKRSGKVEQEHALYDIGQITITSRGVSLSTDLIEECVERGIQINFLTSAGKPYAKLTSPSLSATVAIRREQILAFTDKRGRDFAKQVVLAKTKNQVNLIKYLSKYRRTADPELFSELTSAAAEIEAIRLGVDRIRGDNIDEVRGQLLSVEGRAGEAYWNAIEMLLPEDLNFERRVRRGATDPVNVCLNYGYGILYTRVWGALLLAGLEPFAGFLHVDRPGKPSLVLDMVEEFRQPVVDRAIFGWMNRGGRPIFDEQGLAIETRKEIVARLQEKLEAPEAYEGKKHKVRQIIQEQSRRLASFLRENRRYEGFTMQW